MVAGLWQWRVSFEHFFRRAWVIRVIKSPIPIRIEPLPFISALGPALPLLDRQIPEQEAHFFLFLLDLLRVLTNKHNFPSQPFFQNTQLNISLILLDPLPLPGDIFLGGEPPASTGDPLGDFISRQQNGVGLSHSAKFLVCDIRICLGIFAVSCVKISRTICVLHCSVEIKIFINHILPKGPLVRTL